MAQASLSRLEKRRSEATDEALAWELRNHGLGVREGSYEVGTEGVELGVSEEASVPVNPLVSYIEEACTVS